jgi:catecholate siderophore receptor
MKKFIVNGLGAILFLMVLGSTLFAAESQERTDMDEMVVTATRVKQDRMDVPFNVSVVTRDDIEKMGATTLEHALRRIPGLQIGTQGNAFPHIEIRGSRDTKDLAILINGVPFRQVNGSADLTMIPIGIVERIEFVKGPSSSIWGRGAVAGTLNIITVPDDVTDKQAAVAVRAGSFQTYGADARALLPYEKGYAMINGGASTSNGFQDRTDRETRNAMVTLDHRFSDTLSLGLQAIASHVDAKRGSTTPIVDGNPMDGVSREDNFAIDNAAYEGKYQAVTLSPLLKLSDHLQIKNDLTLIRFDRYATGGTTVIAKPNNKGWWISDSDQTGIHNDLQMRLSHTTDKFDNTFLAGTYIELGSQDQDNPYYSWSSMPKYGPPDWQTPLTNIGNPSTGTTNGTVKKSEFDQKIYSFYAQDTMVVGDVSLMAGLRYDHFNEELTLSTTTVTADQSDSALSPRFGVSWKFYDADEKESVFFANYSQGFRTQFPKLSTSQGITLPQLLEPEETKGYEAGVKFTHGNSLFTQVSYFRTHKKGPRSFRTSTDDFLFTNAKTRVDGIEAEINWQVSKQIQTWAHYAYHDARYEEFNDKSGNSFEGNRVRMSPRHIAGIGANFQIAWVNWNISANYVGDRNLRDNTTGNLQNLDDYITVNTALSVPVGDFTLQLAVNNIFDENYIADDFSSKDAGYPGEPLNFTFIVRADF